MPDSLSSNILQASCLHFFNLSSFHHSTTKPTIQLIFDFRVFKKDYFIVDINLKYPRSIVVSFKFILRVFADFAPLPNFKFTNFWSNMRESDLVC
ncbi:hypothetical protein L6452_26577 [Arctium lappa]|uniref:Uncharacterized protein n=1 Tax=Arctium lappa TaxID=4217 RepID=A0ACB8ZUZ5_ARCLA|nr:hypothetical protein L6452_26577 [Arctium lappa]